MEAVFLYIVWFLRDDDWKRLAGGLPSKTVRRGSRDFYRGLLCKKESPISSQLEQIAGKVFQGLYPCLLAMSLCRILLWLREIRF